MMRDDMFKVIVERPRLVNSNGYSGDGRPYHDREDGPLRLGMKKGYNSKKYLNENLRPLQRFLESRVNRPWNKVYSEICENIDTRNTVKQHILQHIEDFVIVKTGWEDDGDGGHVTAYLDYGGHSRLEEVNRALYVHPLTGILLRNRKYLSRSAKNRKIREADDAARSATHRVISLRVQLHCIEGIWYELNLREIPPAQRIPYHHNGEARIRTVYPPVWDVMRQCRVDGGSLSVDWSVPRRYRAFYGDPNLYAASKRQLGAKELRKHGLTNKARAGLVSFYLAIARTIWQCLLWHATCSKKARQKPA